MLAKRKCERCRPTVCTLVSSKRNWQAVMHFIFSGLWKVSKSQNPSGQNSKIILFDAYLFVFYATYLFQSPRVLQSKVYQYFSQHTLFLDSFQQSLPDQYQSLTAGYFFPMLVNCLQSEKLPNGLLFHIFTFTMLKSTGYSCLVKIGDRML